MFATNNKIKKGELFSPLTKSEAILIIAITDANPAMTIAAINPASSKAKEEITE